jgi:Na+-translocating ferredoxin:NAD+ oxidoreductase RnfD subunit
MSFSISGNVGVPGALVSYSGIASGNVTADGSGNFSIPGLAAGAYTLTPTLIGYVFTPASQPVTITSGNITGIDFTAAIGGYTILTPIVPTDGSDAVLSSGTELNIAEVAADTENGNSITLTGREVLLLHNTDTVAHTVTIISVPDNYGRSSDIESYSIPAGEIATISFLGMFGQFAWKQTDGTVHFQVSSSTVLLTVLQINLI